MSEIKKKILAFFSIFFQIMELHDDEDIFSLGYVNSLFTMQLILFIENEFQIKIESADLELENFRTINAITALIQRKISVAAD